MCMCSEHAELQTKHAKLQTDHAKLLTAFHIVCDASPTGTTKCALWTSNVFRRLQCQPRPINELIEALI